MLKVIGVDPGLLNTGIGIIEGLGNKILSYSFGCISTKPKDPQAKRLHHIYTNFNDLLKENKPNLIVIESAFSLYKNPQSGLSLGMVLGVINLASYENKIQVMAVSVKELKQTLSQNGNASKEQVEKVVRDFLNHKTKISPSHCSDALALAIFGLHRLEIEN